MNLWNKLVVGAKFLFGGFESATDYLLDLLNKYLSKASVSNNVQKAREYVASILGYMRKYEKYCPAIWATHYEKLETAIQTLLDVFEDSKITPDELDGAVSAFKDAIEEWMK